MCSFKKLCLLAAIGLQYSFYSIKKEADLGQKPPVHICNKLCKNYRLYFCLKFQLYHKLIVNFFLAGCVYVDVYVHTYAQMRKNS